MGRKFADMELAVINMGPSNDKDQQKENKKETSSKPAERKEANFELAEQEEMAQELFDCGINEASMIRSITKLSYEKIKELGEKYEKKRLEWRKEELTKIMSSANEQNEEKMLQLRKEELAKIIGSANEQSASLSDASSSGASSSASATKPSFKDYITFVKLYDINDQQRERIEELSAKTEKLMREKSSDGGIRVLHMIAPSEQEIKPYIERSKARGFEKGLRHEKNRIAIKMFQNRFSVDEIVDILKIDSKLVENLILSQGS
jgi:hypothetical protein